ncbi:MAG: hypothetical protein DSM106950_24005 [Stigonema ocellatum SAG 48.90 = DSM 106950]|nr:hypothetical protein [Stigonema ocellatum SAG 48.90 = DSM 106950]
MNSRSCVGQTKVSLTSPTPPLPHSPTPPLPHSPTPLPQSPQINKDAYELKVIFSQTWGNNL